MHGIRLPLTPGQRQHQTADSPLLSLVGLGETWEPWCSAALQGALISIGSARGTWETAGGVGVVRQSPPAKPPTHTHRTPSICHVGGDSRGWPVHKARGSLHLMFYLGCSSPSNAWLLWASAPGPTCACAHRHFRAPPQGPPPATNDNPQLLGYSPAPDSWHTPKSREAGSISVNMG